MPGRAYGRPTKIAPYTPQKLKQLPWSKRLKVHILLKKAESALATQSGPKNWVADFLQRRRVPGFTSPACPCGWHRQTPKHAIMFCSHIADRERMLREAGANNYRVVTDSSKSLKVLTALLIKSGILGQFSLAVQLLYEAAPSSFFFSRVVKT